MKKLAKRLVILVLTFGILSALTGQQLCEGSLGENIFTDGDFGRGPSNIFGMDPGLADGYIYTFNPPPEDGLYTLTNNTALWSNNFGTWLSIQDNSSDPQGYMMVVNASFEPGIFYEKTIDGLCENTLYEFSADIINMIRPGVQGHILPNVDFLLDDEVQYSTGSIVQDGKWNTYGFTFSLDPGQTSVKLTLINNAPGGIGNDLALDNISFQPCGPNSFINTDNLIFLCEDDNQPEPLIADIASGSYAVQWQISRDMGGMWEDIPGANEDIFYHAEFDAGTYYYRYLTAGSEVNLQNTKCRTISALVVIEVLPLSYMVRDTFCEGFSYDFNGLELFDPGDYVDSLISSRGCDSIVYLSLAEAPFMEASIDLHSEDPACHDFRDGQVTVDDISGGYPPYFFNLDTLSNSTGTFSNLGSGDYQLVVTDRNGCLYQRNIALINPPEFSVELPPDTTVVFGQEIAIGFSSTQPPAGFAWFPSNYLDCTDCSQVNSLPGEDILYTLTAENENGCVSADSIFVRVDKRRLPVFVPNIFSPNGDGINDRFGIEAKPGIIVSIDEFTIFDRWGSVVYATKSGSPDFQAMEWDGRSKGQELSAGVFVYLVRVTLIDEKQYVLSGDITLVR